MTLYHYTCDHGAEGIRRDGVVRPHPHPWLPTPLAWFTDLESPFREALGLTSQILSCDRTAHRFEVGDPSSVIWWPACCRRLDMGGLRRALEEAHGAMPAHWWISTEPIPIVLSGRRSA